MYINKQTLYLPSFLLMFFYYIHCFFCWYFVGSQSVFEVFGFVSVCVCVFVYTLNKYCLRLRTHPQKKRERMLHLHFLVCVYDYDLSLIPVLWAGGPDGLCSFNSNQFIYMALCTLYIVTKQLSFPSCSHLGCFFLHFAALCMYKALCIIISSYYYYLGRIIMIV